MARRGPYAKGVAKREEILDKALELVASAGYSRTTVRELAEAVGLSQTGLLHYFGSKEELFKEILRRRDELDRRTFGFDPEAGGGPVDVPDGTVRLVAHNAQVPGLVQLYSRFASEAAEAGHPAHEFFGERYLLARRTFTEGVERMRQAGELPQDLDAERLATLALALMDGLQMQWMYDPEVDMADHLAHFWGLITGRGEDGAARRESP
ncbi:TetR/AcrR family transcriptional regulator [Streptomyces sp. A7024]|uniref:TetR/AcrR family transcriptional regulator n=1 Tax=Streptomyces coryli TaxID=1128680 RepID=A0A6G4U7S7_9ACTN|nr:TetR/AcrR family transcriptional regulator [Streptomyces coryli]NGN67766.1 TetR/AcrR family transcriptional regulator [Streptomyces coryli]